MPNDPNSLDYDPQNFATPGQIAANRGYAEALMRQGLVTPTGTSGNVTAVSPFAIGTQALQSALGRYQLDKAAAGERANINSLGSLAGPTPPNAPPGFGQPTTSFGDITSKQEGTGNYAQIGPATRTGDHAYGKYQVLGANIPQWTAEVTGRPMSVQEFLANPQVQDMVYQKKFGEYVQKYGPEGAARAWYGGEGNVNNPNARDLANPNAPTVGQYGQRFMQLASNSPGIPTMGGPDAMAVALGGQTAPQAAAPSPPLGPQLAQETAARTPYNGAMPMPPSGGLPGQVPIQPGQQGGQLVAPGMFGGRQQMSPAQLQNILHAAAVNPNNMAAQLAAQQALGSYQSQFQPLQFETATGTIVMDSQGRQQFIGKVIQQQVEGPGGMKVPRTIQGQPDGSWRVMGIQGPQSALPPPRMGEANPTASPPAVAPNATAGAPGPQSAAAAPTKLASLETGGTMTDAPPPGANPPPGMLGTAPPPTEGGQTAATIPPVPDTKVAQNIDPYTAQTMGQLMNMGVDYESRKAMTQEMGKQASEFVNTTRTKAQEALLDKNNLDLLQNIMESPNYNPGLLSPITNFGQRLQSAIAQNFPQFAQQLGLDPHKSSATEVSEKLTNELNLGSLRQKLGGLGQVRVFEGAMVKNAFANMDNSIAANKAVLALAQAVNRRIQEVQEYASTLPHDDINIQDKVVSHFKNMPVMSEQEEKQWNSQIEAEVAARKQQQSGGASNVLQGGLPPGAVKRPREAPASDGNPL